TTDCCLSSRAGSDGAGGMEKKLPLALALAQKHGAGEPAWARPWRWAKTAFFLVAMLASLLLVCAPPLLVVLLDLALPPMLLSAHLHAGADLPHRSFLPAVLDQARAFEFRSSLVDLPAVSAARALLILCAYTVCGGGGGAYLWVVAASAAASVSYVLAKAAAVLPRGATPQGKGAAGPEPMLLLSLSLAAAHIAVAYRTSCRERRRLLVYRIDVEAVRLKGGHQTPKGLKQCSV
uniref:MENTAL domain-containing protein n=3 Tax=Triticinae TaxID=1648030 RepID=A0A452YWG5_AEGTS